MPEHNLVRKERFYNIDFLRFIFAVMIVIYHIKTGEGDKFLSAYIPGIYHWHVFVDFFFIIAGFFLFKTLDTTQETFDFAKKKFMRLAPLLYLLLFCSFISNLLFKTIFSFDGNLIKLFLLQDLGFAPTVPSGIPWFISVLFWTSLFYFYITKIIDKKYLNLFMWLTTVCSLGFVLNLNNFDIDAHSENLYYFINTGIVRGLGGMGIGYFILMLYKNEFLQKSTSKLSKIIISGIEIFCITFLTYYIVLTDKLPGRSGFLYLLFFSVIFYLFLIGKGIVSKCLNRKSLGFLGNYSYAIYVMQPVFLMLSSKYLLINSNSFFINHPLSCGMLVTVLCTITGILSHYLYEKPINKLVKNKHSTNSIEIKN